MDIKDFSPLCDSKRSVLVFPYFGILFWFKSAAYFCAKLSSANPAKKWFSSGHFSILRSETKSFNHETCFDVRVLSARVKTCSPTKLRVAFSASEVNYKDIQGHPSRLCCCL